MFDDGRIFPVFCVKKKDGQTMLFFCLRLEKGRWIEYHERRTFHMGERKESCLQWKSKKYGPCISAPPAVLKKQ